MTFNNLDLRILYLIRTYDPYSYELELASSNDTEPDF
jgi:hypothetical protein